MKHGFKKFTVAMSIIAVTLVLALAEKINPTVGLILMSVGSLYPISDAAQNAAKEKWGKVTKND